MATAPLVRLRDGTWCLEDEGAALLKSLADRPVVVVAVAGMYRTGKSFFLNALAGHTAERSGLGFRVGSTSESCTRGIDICVPAQPAELAGAGQLVLLDTEGISSMDQDETYDAQVFALGLLLSSFFVLNSMGVIDEAAIDRLYLVGELSKHISVAAHDDADDELASHIPRLMWLLRDFVLDLTADGRQLTPDEYMERALAARAEGARRAAERNGTRASLRTLFQWRSCCTLVRPVADEAEL